MLCVGGSAGRVSHDLTWQGRVSGSQEVLL